MDLKPLILSVPQGGNKTRRDAYTERCDMCGGDIPQNVDKCPDPDCLRPVVWQNSVIYDKLIRSRSNQRVDSDAKARREQSERLSDTTGVILAIARATSPTHSYDYPKGVEHELLEYERAYGAKLLTTKLNDFKSRGDKGGGLVKHLLNYLQSYNPSEAINKKDKSRLLKWQ